MHRFTLRTFPAIVLFNSVAATMTTFVQFLEQFPETCNVIKEVFKEELSPFLNFLTVILHKIFETKYFLKNLKYQAVLACRKKDCIFFYTNYTHPKSPDFEKKFANANEKNK